MKIFEILKYLGRAKDIIGIIFWFPVLLMISFIFAIHDFFWWQDDNKMKENFDNDFMGDTELPDEDDDLDDFVDDDDDSEDSE